ncbi:modulator of macroautophagy TMEM150B isoform X1 [Trachypithecus francoisi]|uniref:modulator of macroautophagy TMEM150B isoform X1 n=1 Tax=Trachypithecus francoisi TaxID=54180 RepID=UPI00141B5866|nr:modulator of macroautophagy TMEM150B isoform X1 [Trachypithecus francoisi]
MPALLPQAHPAPVPGLRAPGSLERAGFSGVRETGVLPQPRSFTCRARHVGLPVADARLPSCLGYLWRLDRFCHRSDQQDCRPQQRLSLHQHLRILPPSELHLQPAAWICIIRYHQLRDWGVGRWPNQLILWTGLLCALGTSVVGNFQEKNQRPTHLAGAFLAFILGNVYFWLQLLLWRLKSLPQPGAPWIGPLRLGLCSFCTILIVASILLVSGVGVGGGSSLESVSLSGCVSLGTSLPFSGLQHLHRITALSSRMPTLGSRCPGWNALSSTH